MNGWRNEDTFTVAEWLGNDPGIYFAAVEYATNNDAPTWNDFLDWSGLCADVTGCAAFDSPDLDAEELTELLVDMGAE